jgi:hypothetical protein
MLAVIWPFVPTVTWLSGKWMLPSTLPSMNRNSEPVISPFTIMLFPIVFWWLANPALPAASRRGERDFAGRSCSRVGEMGRVLVELDFHMAFNSTPFPSRRAEKPGQGQTAAPNFAYRQFIGSISLPYPRECNQFSREYLTRKPTVLTLARLLAIVSSAVVREINPAQAA